MVVCRSFIRVRERGCLRRERGLGRAKCDELRRIGRHPRDLAIDLAQLVAHIVEAEQQRGDLVADRGPGGVATAGEVRLRVCHGTGPRRLGRAGLEPDHQHRRPRDWLHGGQTADVGRMRGIAGEPSVGIHDGLCRADELGLRLHVHLGPDGFDEHRCGRLVDRGTTEEYRNADARADDDAHTDTQPEHRSHQYGGPSRTPTAAPGRLPRLNARASADVTEQPSIPVRGAARP